MFTPPGRFCIPREHGPPFVSQRVDEIGNVSFVRPFIHVRNFHYIFGYTLVSPDQSGCTSRDHDLSHSLLVKTSKPSKVHLWPKIPMTGACWVCGRAETSLLTDLKIFDGKGVGLSNLKNPLNRKNQLLQKENIVEKNTKN